MFLGFERLVPKDGRVQVPLDLAGQVVVILHETLAGDFRRQGPPRHCPACACPCDIKVKP